MKPSTTCNGRSETINWRMMCLYLFIFVGSLCNGPATQGARVGRYTLLIQTKNAEPDDAPFDPLKQITSSFPGSVKLNEKRRTLEFCPDETCDGFVAANGVSVPAMKDFAYLYVYYFSDYLAYLPDWRKLDDAKNAAERVLSKLDYRDCQNKNSRDAARCVLLRLSQKGAIRLIFVRYDEGKRNVVPENILEHLSEKKPVQN